MNSKNSSLFHKRLPEFEVFDEISLRVVPRYKTSELSGDEWRSSVHIQLFFKKHVVYEERVKDMQTATLLLGRIILIDAMDGGAIPNRVLSAEKVCCDQPSCHKPAVSTYQLKQEFSERGEKLDTSDISCTHFRRFCTQHLRRGDANREDCDGNYEVIEGPGPSESKMPGDDKSPVQFGGFV